MFPSEVFPRSTRDVGIMDWNFKSFTCGKADGETVAWEGLWMATDLISVFLRVEPFAISLHIYASRFLLWHYILCYSDVELFYTGTFLYACTASTMPSFLLFTQNKFIQRFISTYTSLRTTRAIHRFMKNSFPSLQHAAALVGCFLTNWQAVYMWKLSRKKKYYSTYKQQSKQFQFIVVNTLFPAPSIPSVNHTSCAEFYHQSIKKIELIPSPRGHYLATIPLTKS